MQGKTACDETGVRWNAGWGTHPSPLRCRRAGQKSPAFSGLAWLPRAKYVLPKDLPVSMSRLGLALPFVCPGRVVPGLCGAFGFGRSCGLVL
jgi:hypothetical protein